MRLTWHRAVPVVALLLGLVVAAVWVSARPPSLVSSVVDPDPATVCVGDRSARVDSVTETYNDGSMAARGSSADAPGLAGRDAPQPVEGLSEADLRHWVTFQPGSSSDCPRVGESKKAGP